MTDPAHDRARSRAASRALQCHPSRLSIRKEYCRHWREREQGGLLWVTSGVEQERTALLCDIIDEVEGQSPNRIAYFFCQENDPRGDNALAILRSLVYLLIVQQTSLVSHVQAKFDVAGQNLFADRNAWVAICEIFTNMLMDINSPRVFLVVDALEHCKWGQASLLKLIIRSSSPRVRWIVSSNAGEEIDKQLQLDPLRTVLDLELDVTYEDLERRHRETIQGILSFNSEESQYCLRLLSIVLIAHKPLLLEELGVLAGLSSTESIAAAVHRCGSFLSVTDGTVNFANRFSKSYLSSPSAREVINQGPNPHGIIFQRSLAVMLETLHRNMYDLEDPAFDIDEDEKPDTNRLVSLGYSCIYWVDHLTQWLSTQDSQSVSELEDGGSVDGFLRSKYLYWLEALSFLGHLAAGKTAMEKLETLLRVSSPPNNAFVLISH